MTLSSRIPTPRPGEKLGDAQFAEADRWEAAGRLALVGIGVEPGPLRRLRPLRRATSSSPRSTTIGIRDGANLEVDGYEFAPTFSIWTTIEECLNPPVIWERDRGWYTTEPFSEPRCSSSRRGSARWSA